MPDSLYLKLPGMRLQDAKAMLEANGIRCQCEEYCAPGRQRHGDDFRVIRARLSNGCAKLIYAGFITDIPQQNDG